MITLLSKNRITRLAVNWIYFQLELNLSFNWIYFETMICSKQAELRVERDGISSVLIINQVLVAIRIVF